MIVAVGGTKGGIGKTTLAVQLATAQACAGKRVVLKWPRKGPPMPGLRAPSHQIVGKTLRYDVFMTAAS